MKNLMPQRPDSNAAVLLKLLEISDRDVKTGKVKPLSAVVKRLRAKDVPAATHMRTKNKET
jgi:hypothetical protein